MMEQIVGGIIDFQIEFWMGAIPLLLALWIIMWYIYR